jgi:hypothetical protein
MYIGHKVFYSSVPVLLEIFFAEIILSFSRDGCRKVRASSQRVTAENGPTEIKTETDKQNRQIQTILPNNEFLEVSQLLQPYIRMVAMTERFHQAFHRVAEPAGKDIPRTQLIPLMHSVIRQLGSKCRLKPFLTPTIKW